MSWAISKTAPTVSWPDLSPCIPQLLLFILFPQFFFNCNIAINHTRLHCVSVSLTKVEVTRHRSNFPFRWRIFLSAPSACRRRNVQTYNGLNNFISLFLFWMMVVRCDGGGRRRIVSVASCSSNSTESVGGGARAKKCDKNVRKRL